MSASSGVSLTFRVGQRYICTLSAPKPERGGVLAMTAEWSPHVPSRLTNSELRAYRRGRDAFIAELAAQIGGSALVIEAEQ
jgi:hypothetical protein